MTTKGRNWKRTKSVWNTGLKYKDIGRYDIIEKTMKTKKEKGIAIGNEKHFISKYEIQLKPYLEKQGFIHNFRYSLKGTYLAKKNKISYFQLDFYDPVKKWIIEIYGKEHKSTNQIIKDTLKKDYFLSLGFWYVEMTNEEAQTIYEQYRKYIIVPQIVEKTIEVDYGHRLPNHCSHCKFVHGHRGKIIIGIEGHLIAEEGISSQGMVIDFKDLKRIAMEKIHDVMDHGFMVYENDKKMIKFLKDNKQRYVITKDIPTAENLAKWCFNQINEDIKKHFENKIIVKYVKFYETPTSVAEYKGDELT